MSSEGTEYLMEKGVPFLLSRLLKELYVSYPRPDDPKQFIKSSVRRKLGLPDEERTVLSLGAQGLWYSADELFRILDSDTPAHQIELIDGDFSALHMVAALRKDDPSLFHHLLRHPEVDLFADYSPRGSCDTIPGVYDFCRMLNTEAAKYIETTQTINRDPAFQYPGAEHLYAAAQGNIGALQKFSHDELMKSPCLNLTALHCAAANGQVKCVKWLVEEKGFKIDEEAKLHELGTPPLLLAIEGAHVECCKFFLSKRETVVNSALEYLLVRPGLTSMVQWLVTEGGVDPTSRDYFYHGSLIQQAAAADRLDLVKWAVEKNVCSVSEGKEGGKGLANRACAGGGLSVLQWLSEERGEDINTEDSHSRPPLIIAARNGHLPIVKYLVSRGAQVNLTDNTGQTALHHAAEENRLEVVKWLVQEGADVGMLTEDEYGPATYPACSIESLNMVQYLVQEAGTMLTPKDKEKIEADGHPNTKQWLQQAGYL